MPIQWHSASVLPKRGIPAISGDMVSALVHVSPIARKMQKKPQGTSL
jgi:hypothetical protein